MPCSLRPLRRWSAVGDPSRHRVRPLSPDTSRDRREETAVRTSARDTASPSPCPDAGISDEALFRYRPLHIKESIEIPT